MTLPAHRFQHRQSSSDGSAEGDATHRTWTFDKDETITQAPEMLARIATGLKALGDRIIVVTGDSGPREKVLAQLADLQFPFDALIQYDDNESAGLNRLEILKQLDAYGAFDDRAGRAPTLTRQCPHLFLAANPPDSAQDRAENGKKDAKKLTQNLRDLRENGAEQTEMEAIGRKASEIKP